ncbi:hypothetical protein EDB87DRAFT_1342861 [Lactarius vividus]|nr:hypothetical protein EDB87DRAFT_1342861 [Lactarius vividus]
MRHGHCHVQWGCCHWSRAGTWRAPCRMCQVVRSASSMRLGLAAGVGAGGGAVVVAVAGANGGAAWKSAHKSSGGGLRTILTTIVTGGHGTSKYYFRRREHLRDGLSARLPGKLQGRLPL